MIYINGENLALQQMIDVVRGFEKVALDQEGIEKVKASRKLVEELIERGEVVYGITTGFGKLADVMIPQEKVEELQRNLILSHACGVGDPLPKEVVRAMMLLRANALVKGYSGIRLETLQLLVDMLNADVVPVVYSQGSVGASGDLVPLAHMVLVMLGYGEAYYQGERMPGDKALIKAGLKPITLGAKEGLALINGTQCMTALGALGVYDSLNLAKTADICAALTMEALQGIPDAYDERIQQLRPHPGQLKAARNIRAILNGSGLVYRKERDRVQDAYTLRCTPQVHGASRDAINYVAEVVVREINSATDNPLIFPEDGIVFSGGNFHGQPIALAMDFLGIALAELANISERRIERLVNSNLSGLPPFLIADSGINSGYMIAQYTAASLVSENKVLSHPASVDSIPTSANQEDHVSMGTIAARKMYNILTNAENVLAVELLTAAQALEFRDKDKLASGTKAVYDLIRSSIPALTHDRLIAPEIHKMQEKIHSGEIIQAVEQVVGLLL
ncbi:histidine ammonia-lyase [Anoxybacter fermentans]|uniref:Histidine ammonia-lyase n=2 Tax=Bacteria TaxID=2 RepID=A0A3S9T224_9FIRM|nr:histidine ammonia-lyase [Anoxybacter fermentans]AZR74608.1 histidine ammonia-lyase [Anoxybacter fermentans]